MDLTSLAGTLLKFGGTVIGTALGGPAGGAVAGTILGELAKQFGTDATPEAVSAAIAADPDAAAKIQAVESSKAADDLADLNARLADVQDARATTVKLVEQGSAIAWGPVAISIMIVLGFLGMAVLLMFRQVPDSQLAIVVFTTLSTGFGAVMNYWLGSSAGSKSSGDTIRQIAQQATIPTAGQVAGKAIDAAVKSIGTKR